MAPQQAQAFLKSGSDRERPLGVPVLESRHVARCGVAARGVDFRGRVLAISDRGSGMPTDIRFNPAPKPFDLRELMPVALFSGSGLLASLVVILGLESI